MNILITAPSLDPLLNVSGVSSVVNNIIQFNKQHHYFHYQLGKLDRTKSKMSRLVKLIGQLLFFPFAIKRNKIELVHQNLPFDPKGLTREYLINLWCRILGIPVVLHIHGGVFLMRGTQNPFFTNISKSIFKHSKKVIVLSEVEKKALNEKYNYPSAIVLHNSIDTSYFINPDKKRLTSKKPIFLFLGRIHESKGIEEIIEAFKLLKGNLEFRFILCGIGTLKDDFVSACERILGSNFEYRGIVSGDEKLKIIKESDLFILPSRYGEGLPMALLETMACGVVPVVTDDASMKYIVQHETNGLRINKRDSKDLYEKLKRLFSDPIMFEKLSINATATVTRHYDISSFVVHLNEIYNSAIE